MKTTKPMLPFILLFASICMQTNAATFTVTNNTDADPGSLRQAILDANGAAGADTIIFNGVTGTITLASALTQITDALKITGPGANILSVSGNNAVPVFDILQADVIISGLSIINANNPSSSTGGGILFRGVTIATPNSLTILDCAFSNNSAGFGGAIYSTDGSINISGCVFTSNIATMGTGGGILVMRGSNAITNCTFSGNSAGTRGGAIEYIGNGGIHPNALFITNCTISENSASIGGGISDITGPATLSNTIVAGNSAPTGPDVFNLSTSFTSHGYNIIGKIDGSSGFPFIGDQLGTIASPINPMLFELANNGGPTKTMALQCGSPAIDEANPITTGIDQRGIAMFNGRRDIGAYESTIQPLVATCSGTNVTCFGGATGTASVTVTGGPSTVIGLGPVGAPLPFQGILDASSIYDTCNCPPGYVAVGFEGRVGSFVDQFKLKCRQLLPNGTLGAALVNTCTNGNSASGSPVGPYLSATDQALVRFTIMESTDPCPNCSMKGMNADSKSISQIYSGSSNATGLSNTGGFETFDFAAHPETAPDGNVITGMINYMPLVSGRSQGVQFRFAPVINVPAQVEYLWSNGATTSSISNLTAGTYTVTVTKGGCSTATCSYIVSGPSALVSVDAGPNKIVYKGYPDSSCTTLQSTISGGTPPLTRQWSTVGTPNLGSGSSINVCPTASRTYYLTVTDVNGCSNKDSVRVCVFDVRCGSGNKKVTVCHGTGSANNPFQTLCILPADAKWHMLNHPGEKLGACGMVKTCGFSTLRESDEEMTEGVEEEMGLTVYPNPAQNEMNISLHSEVDGKYLLRLVDITGQILLSEMKDVSAGENQYTVNMQNFAPGIYTVLLQSGDNLVQTRIVKE